MNNIIQEIAKMNGARFVSFLYRSKQSGELSRYVVGMGVDYDKVYRRDLKVVSLVKPANDIEELAKRELLDSLKDSIKLGIGNNPRYTCKGTYKNLFNGLKVHLETFDFHVNGFLLKKTVIEEGEYKEVKSAPKTIAKNRIRKRMKLSKFRQFVLPNIKEARMNGKVLEIES